MVPSFMSHIIAVVTLAIPGMILAETALSFLGIGLRPPIGGELGGAVCKSRKISVRWQRLPGSSGRGRP